MKKQANLQSWDFSHNSAPNYLWVSSAEMLKVLLIETDLVGIPGLKNEWINNFAEYGWMCDNAISIPAKRIENEMLHL